MTIEDFKIPGAKLPHIPSDTEYRCENWGKNSKNDTLITPNRDNISFGVVIYKGEEYILADRPDTIIGCNNHYMFKVSDIERLAKKQGMIKEEKTLPKSFACKNTDEVLWKKYIAWLNKTYGVDFIGYCSTDYIYYGITICGDVDNHIADKFDVILTLEEWDEIVNGKQETKIEVMNKTIKKSDLKKIYDVACSTWQGKIEKLANRNAFGDTVELTQSEIDEMFKAADSSQTRVLEEVFGKQLKELDFRSDDINLKVDGLPVFGGKNVPSREAFIGLPYEENMKSSFYLNPNYNWTLKNNKLTVTKK